MDLVRMKTHQIHTGSEQMDLAGICSQWIHYCEHQWIWVVYRQLSYFPRYRSAVSEYKWKLMEPAVLSSPFTRGGRERLIGCDFSQHIAVIDDPLLNKDEGFGRINKFTDYLLSLNDFLFN
ncbi:hypothetical protein MSG28_000707 [Choristoneura fumiferana]|uniref:Uncharacterized protein n=1 Tax=Choristoneura fumiferana TaxID=7141 RepID=A0ACC0K2M4_CHOFU|nr:hypothetical protein MSG28_000707 [Choristoneura fumiferana]